MNHILDLNKACKDGRDFANLNDWLADDALDLSAFEALLKENINNPEFGKDTVGFIYRTDELTGVNSDDVGEKTLCEESDSQIMTELQIDDDSTGKEWEEYYDATTDARSAIMDTIAHYAVLVSITDEDRTFVMLNSWHDPIFEKTFPLCETPHF